jgi:NDP-sugar pyrophosphorylase family protein
MPPAIILAGGLGTRLQPVLPDRPKGLARIGSDSFLRIQIRLLRGQGFRQFVLCVGHRAQQVQSALGDGRKLGVGIEYSVEEGGLLGTAGALRQAARWFAPRALVLNGDTYFNINYARFVNSHERQRRRFRDVVASLVVARAEAASQCGAVELDVKSRLVKCFEEKRAQPVGGAVWFNGGAYVLERQVLDGVTPKKPCSLEREVFPRLLADGKLIAAMGSKKLFFDIGTPDGLERFRAFYLATTQSGSHDACDPPCSSTATA